MDNVDFRHQHYRHQHVCYQCILLQNIIQQESEKHNTSIERYENIIYHQEQKIQRLNEIIDWLKTKLVVD